MRCSTPPPRNGAPKCRVEPIRVAVRIRPLREQVQAAGDGEGVGSGVGRGGGGQVVWRTSRVGDNKQSIFLVPGTPRVASWASLDGTSGGTSGRNSSGGLGSGSLSDSGVSVSSVRPYHEKARFTFDICFEGNATNEEVFELAARNVLRSSLDGSDATVLAYGQTASGKTHSILGNFKQPGILPLAMQDLFKTEGARMVGLNARVSYFEIFNERVLDLLAPSVSTSESGLPVKEDVERGFYVQGLVEPTVRSAKDVLRLIERGEERRRYAQTRWNEYSSRSHVLFTLVLERPVANAKQTAADGTASVSPSGLGIGAGRSVKVNVVDLAGCENHKLEQSEDGRYINRSLFFLGEVISRLCVSAPRGDRSRSASRRHAGRGEGPREATPKRRGVGCGSRESTPGGARNGREGSVGSATSRSRSPASRDVSRDRSDFIPYRDSKLTRILRASLGGNAMTLLLATVHPSLQFVEQSMTSLRFAAKAQNVENCVSFYNDDSPLCSDEQSTIAAQQRVIEGLRQKLRALELGQAAPRGLPPQLPTSPESRSRDADVRGGGLRSRSACGDADLNDISGANREEQRRMVEQFRGLRNEIEEKEVQLAAKTRLLSEREWQLGQLQNQLVGNRGNTAGAAQIPLKLEAAGSYPTSTVPQRYGPPDEGGGLPVVDCGSRRPPSPPGGGGSLAYPSHAQTESAGRAAPGISSERRSQEVADNAHRQYQAASGGGFRERAPEPPPPPPPPPAYLHTAARQSLPVDSDGLTPSVWSSPSLARSPLEAAGHGRVRSATRFGDGPQPPQSRRQSLHEDAEVDMPTAHQQVQSRAEDVVCLRRHERYVRRQQMPMGAGPPPAPASATDIAASAVANVAYGNAHGGASSHVTSGRASTVYSGGRAAGVGEASALPASPEAVAAAANVAAAAAANASANSAVPQSESQKALVERLLYLAVLQINNVTAAGGSIADASVPGAAQATASSGMHGTTRGASDPAMEQDGRSTPEASPSIGGNGTSLHLDPPPSNPNVQRTPRFFGSEGERTDAVRR